MLYFNTLLSHTDMFKVLTEQETDPSTESKCVEITVSFPRQLKNSGISTVIALTRASTILTSSA